MGGDPCVAPHPHGCRKLGAQSEIGTCRTKTLTSSEFPYLVFLIVSFYVLLCRVKTPSLPQMLFGIRQGMDE